MLTAILQLLIFLTVTLPLALQFWRVAPVSLFPLLQLAVVYPLSSSRVTTSQITRVIITAVVSFHAFGILHLTGRARDIPDLVLGFLFAALPGLAVALPAPLHEYARVWTGLGLGFRLPDSYWIIALGARITALCVLGAFTNTLVLAILVSGLSCVITLACVYCLELVPWYVWESSPMLPPLSPVDLARRVTADLRANPDGVLAQKLPTGVATLARTTAAVADAYRTASKVLVGGSLDHVSRAVYEEAAAPLPADRVLEARVFLSGKWWGRSPPPYDALNCTCASRQSPVAAVPLLVAGKPVDPVLYSSCDINIAFCVWGRHYPAITEPNLAYVVTVQA